jgi:hypothetical protein
MLNKQILFKSLDGVDDTQQAGDAIVLIVNEMTKTDKPQLVALLQGVGSLVTLESTKDQLLDASFKAIRDSAKFRSDLEAYIVSQVSSQSSMDGYSNFSWSAVGDTLKNSLGAILSADNLKAFAGVGIGYLGAKWANDASSGQGQQAIDYTKAQAELADKQAQAKLLELQLLNQQNQPNAPKEDNNKPSTTPKWVLPVAIGGGLLVVGLIVLVAVRKK